MEKRILPIIYIGFIFEVCFFLYELGMLPFLPDPYGFENSNKIQIGKVVSVKENVQRRHQDSIIWDETGKAQKLYHYDSVLTLKNSSAKLGLEGNVRLDLSENTLVVLEPSKSLKTSQFRIRFQKGHLRSRTKTEDMAIATGEWMVEASQNSDLSFQALSNGHFSVEVKQGSAKLTNGNPSNSPPQVVTKGSVIEIGESKILSRKTLSSSLTWNFKTLTRYHYSFQFPLSLQLSWKGQAKRLLAHNTRGESLRIELETRQQSRSLDLQAGTWIFRLEDQNLSSESLTLHLYPASRVSHLYPLPRSRLDIHLPTRFSWLSVPEADSYKIVFRSKDQQRTITHLTKLPYWTGSFESPGSYTWRIEALDESGFEIPSYYEYPVEILEDPLAPPSLRAPNLRAPAATDDVEIDKSIHEGAWLQLLYYFLIPRVYAEEAAGNQKSAPSLTKRQPVLIFSWYPVPGADHYIVEVSEQPDFLEPVVTSKTEKEEFIWRVEQQRIIYYRVAAGKTNGRKGLFSKPQKVDLSKIEEITLSQDLQPGVRVQLSRPEHTLQPRTAQQKEVDFDADAETDAEAEPKPAPEPKRQKEKEASKPALKPLPSDIHFRIGGYWSMGLGINSQTGEDSVNVSQQGFLLSRFGIELSSPFFDMGHLAFLSDILEAPWSSSEAQVFQDDLSQRDQTHSLRFGRTGSSTDYGVFYKIYDVAVRSDFEQIELEEINPIGLAYFFRYGIFQRWDSKHMFGLGYGDDFTHVQSDNYVYTHLELWDDNVADLGFEFNVRFGNGEGGRDYLGTNLLFRLGLMF